MYEEMKYHTTRGNPSGKLIVLHDGYGFVQITDEDGDVDLRLYPREARRLRKLLKQYLREVGA